MWDELVSNEQECRTMDGLLLFALDGKIIKTLLQRYSFVVWTTCTYLAETDVRVLDFDYNQIILLFSCCITYNGNWNITPD